MHSIPRVALYLSAAHDYDLDAVRASDLDVVILDLEASVPTSQRDAARERVVRWLREPPLARRVVLRMNDLATNEGARDMVTLAGCEGVHAILLPGYCEGSIVPWPFDMRPLWVMIENMDGLAWLESDIEAPRMIEAVVIGYKDLAQDMGLAFDPSEPLLIASGQRILAAARKRGLACFDGVWPGGDLRMEEATRRSTAAGFDGITVYVPGNIPLVRRAIAEAYKHDGL